MAVGDIVSAARRKLGEFANVAVGKVGQAFGQKERGISEAIGRFIAGPVQASVVAPPAPQKKISGVGPIIMGQQTEFPPSGGGGPTPEQEKQAQEVINQGYNPNWRDQALKEGKDVNSPEFSSQREMEKAYNQATSVPSFPSAEEEARRAAEERMRRFGEVVAPVQGEVESYLSSRRPLGQLFEEQLKAQGVSEKEKTLGGYETEESKLQEQLRTIPEEEIARRRETGMISAAAERRIRQLEERPVREQLLRTSEAKGQARVGLDRAYDLVDKYLDILREEEQRQIEPIERKLEFAREEFKTEAEGIAERLTGFNEDRKAQLRQYESALAEQRKLSAEDRQAARDLRQLEAENLFKLEQIAAQQQGRQPTQFETVQNARNSIQQLVVAGGTVNEAFAEGARLGVAPEVTLSIYNGIAPTIGRQPVPASNLPRLQQQFGLNVEEFTGEAGGSPIQANQ